MNYLKEGQKSKGVTSADTCVERWEGILKERERERERERKREVGRGRLSNIVLVNLSV